MGGTGSGAIEDPMTVILELEREQINAIIAKRACPSLPRATPSR